MPTPITMPQLGESVTEGVVARWLKAEGDRVERDEPLLEIVTDKVNDEMPSPVSGTLVKILAPEGATVPVGAEIAQVEVESAVPAGAASGVGTGATRQTSTGATANGAVTPGDVLSEGASGTTADGAHEHDSEGEERRRYSPVVKRLAQEHNIDLTALSGSGLSGRVTKNDVLAYVAARQGETAASAASAPTPASSAPVTLAPEPASTSEQALPSMVVASTPLTPAPAATAEPVVPPLGASVATPPPAAPPFAPVQAPAAAPFAPLQAPEPAPAMTPPRTVVGATADEEYLPLTPMRRAIAEHMVRSKTTAPHATTTIEVDMTRLVRWRQANKEAVRARHGVDITFVPLVIAAVVDALKRFPIMNSSWGEDRIILKRRINVGVAVGLEDGLVVPVIHDADEKNLVGLARAVADLAQRARENRLTTADVQGGTFTVNNTGVFGAIVTTPVINQPQAAILAMNAIVKRPVVIEDDAIAVRSIMTLSLSFDHRIVDGLTAGRFMQQVVQNIDRLNVAAI